MADTPERRIAGMILDGQLFEAGRRLSTADNPVRTTIAVISLLCQELPDWALAIEQAGGSRWEAAIRLTTNAVNAYERNSH